MTGSRSTHWYCLWQITLLEAWIRMLVGDRVLNDYQNLTDNNFGCRSRRRTRLACHNPAKKKITLTRFLERIGALQGVGERVEDLLPQDTREKKARANKHAKWAINVSRFGFKQTFRGWLTTALGQCAGKHLAPSLQSRCSILLVVALPYCITCRFRTRLAMYRHCLGYKSLGTMAPK